MAVGTAVLNTIKKLYPFISTAASLGGPLGTLAASAVGKALNVDKVDNTPDAITSAIAEATPDQLLALKNAEQQFQLDMAQAGFKNVEDLASIAAQDRDSARKREESIKDWTPRILAYLIIGAFIFTVTYVLSGKAKAETVLAGTLIGYMSAKAELVLAYYFGSSSTVDKQTDLLAQAEPIKK